MAEASLAERIKRSLDEGRPASAELKALIAEAERERQRLLTEADHAHATSLDPRASVDVVNAARQEGDQCRFEAERLSVALDHLRPALQKAKHRDDAAARAHLVQEVTAERDELADELRELYPRASDQLAKLFVRMSANNIRARALGLETVEGIVRGIPPHGRIGATQLAELTTAVRLPPMDPVAHAHGTMVWPPTKLRFATATVAALDPSAAAGTEMRRIGDEVAQKRRG